MTQGTKTRARGRSLRAKFLRNLGAVAVAAPELSRRTRHVRALLRNMRLDESQALSWVLAFDDEADPLPALATWLEAGWRDPVVVQACLKVCGTREASEAAFDVLDWELSRSWDASIPDALLEVACRM